ncbi:heavy-metal-associated domain-containing protein [Candidatus Micrarchaeota archaeon]|nr:heavy-metal-associated domain-containing protein [Candidatus Micrarchaeota archaeon]
MILKVKGMHCKSCEKLLKMAIEDAVAGAVVVKADYGNGLLEVDADESKVSKIRQAVEAAGFKMAG